MEDDRGPLLLQEGKRNGRKREGVREREGSARDGRKERGREKGNEERRKTAIGRKQ